MITFSRYIKEASTEEALRKKIETKQNQLEVARERRKMSGKSKGVQSQREVKLGSEIAKLRQELHIMQQSRDK